MVKEKYNIIFVCHGNICRSPMAEYIFKYLINKKGLNDNFFVTSKALSNEESGNDIYPPAKRCLIRNKIPFENHQATKINKEDIANADHIIIMDEYNHRLYNYQFESNNKVKKLLYYLGSNEDVSDPWYTDKFDECFHLIYKGVNAFLNYLIDTYKL